MAVKAIDAQATRDYILKDDPDKENPTVIKIGLLDARLKAHIEDRFSDYEVSSQNPEDNARLSMRLHQRSYELVRFGVKEIDNLLDPKTGKPVIVRTDTENKFGKSYPVLPESVMTMITPWIDELAAEVSQETKLSEQERKN